MAAWLGKTQQQQQQQERQRVFPWSSSVKRAQLNLHEKARKITSSPHVFWPLMRFICGACGCR